ncbi:MAG: Tim44 domain-containing protein [Sideroxydans sp.]|nr:Tim44 domain-containing protein [Sideroxydans sp.]
MKRFLMLLTIALTCFSLFAAPAEAKRFGGGMSFGKQRSFSQQQMQRAPAAAPSPAAPGAQPKGNKWLGPLAGLALGAGLGALFMNGGFGGGLLTILLIAVAAMFLLSLFRRPQPAMQYATNTPYDPAEPMQPQYAGGTSAASTIPADFPVDAFLRSAKTSFIRLQAANDRKDLNDIREYTTPEMFAEISMQLHERDHSPQKTDVLEVEANLLEVVSEGNHAIASVRLVGQLRENNGMPENFDEVWHVQKSLNDEHAVWLLAGIQQVA